MVGAKEMQRAVLDLQETRPGPGLRKTLVLAAVTIPLALACFAVDGFVPFAALACATGVAFASWLITTHDAIHHTLTGIAWFDELVPRLISHPLIWVHGMYAEVHKLHHKMNGDDFSDPERVQWTAEEYLAASRLGRFYVRHQWLFDIFIFGGLGLIYKTVKEALHFYPKSKGMRRQVWLDAISIVTCNVAIYTYAASYGMAGRYFLYWLVMERIGGGVLQWRAHVEHYGLWGKGRHYFETQAYNCRNLETTGFGSWFFNRLNYHSVHHAFPRVPFYNLKEAHRRFVALFGRPGIEPLVQDASYVKTALALASRPTVIGPIDQESASGRRLMVPLADVQ